MDIGTLTASLVLEDNMSGILRQVTGVVEEFGERTKRGLSEVSELLGDSAPAWLGYASTATAAGVAVVGAITAITGAITYLGVKGSEIQGVTDAFNDLSEQAGSTGEALLGGLLEGVKHTVDDFDLMKATTRLLSSGIKLTAEDMRIMGATAREMGKATGTDAVHGLEVLSQALMTGQSRLLRRYGIQVDLIQAEKDYAKELGVTRGELNQTEKVEAARVAMLQGAKDKLDLLGESEVSFKEKLMQGTQAIDDWFDVLKTGIATSPHVMAAIDSIGAALSEAFGTTSQSLLDNILYGVDLFADAVTTSAPEIIRELRDIKDEIVNLAYTIAQSDLVSGIKDFYEWLTKIENHPVFKFLMTGSTKGGPVGISDVIKSTNKELSMFQTPAQTGRDWKAFEDKLSKPFTDLFEDIMLGPKASKEIQDFSGSVNDLTKSLGGLLKTGGQIGALNLPEKITKPFDIFEGGSVIEGGGVSGIAGGLGPTRQPRGPSEAAIKAAAEEQKFFNKLLGEDALKAAQLYEKALGKIGGATHTTIEEQKQFDKAFEAVIDKYRAMGPAGEAVLHHFEQVKFEFDAATMGAKNFQLGMYAIPGTLKSTGDTMDNLTSSTVGFNQALIAVTPTLQHTNEVVKSSFIHDPTLKEKIVGGITFGLEESAQRIPQILSNAIINGADWKQTGMAIASEIGGNIGQSIGASIGKFGGPIGSAIGSLLGPLVGKIGDALHRSAGEDVMKRVGTDWGITITEQMGDTIAKQAKTMFKGSRQAAEIFNLNTLLAEGGGLSPENLDRMTHKLHDVFSMLNSGLFTASQAATVLDQNFAEFAAQFDNGLISKGLREIVALTQQAGVNSKAVTQFLQQQASRARGGFEGILSNQLRFSQEGGKATDQLVPVTLEQFERLERLATTTFSAAIAAGEPFLDVLIEMKDSFGLLNEATDQFGYQQNAAFGDLGALSAFFDKNQDLARSIQGTNDMLIALANSNLMTQQTFTDLGDIAVENYNAMIEGGLTNQQALMAQQQTLQTLWELMQEGTFTVDDQTQALIDQAKEAGLVGEAHMDAQERATKAMEDAAKAMEHVGDVLSQVFGIAGDEAETFADRTVAAAQRAAAAMASIHDPGELSQGDLGPAPIPMTEGGVGRTQGPTLFYSGGNEDFAFSGEGQSFGGGGNSAVLDELQGLRSDLTTMQRQFSRLVRDELLTSPKR